MLPSSPIDPVPDQNNVRDETFFLSAIQHIRKQPLGRALHWYGWPSCPLTETDYFIFSLSNQLFVVLLVDVDGVMSMNGNHEGLLALVEKANGIACLMPMQKKASTVKGAKAGWQVIEAGWGLMDAMTVAPVNPPDLVSTDAVAMTPWEVQAYSSQFLAQQLEGLGYELLPEATPSANRRAIWFRRESYEPEWVVARPQYGFAKSLLNFVSAKLWSVASYESRLKRGYIADVTFKDPRNEKKQLPGRQLVRGQSYKAIITSIRRFAASDTFGPFN
jgi:hypothetical protein